MKNYKAIFFNINNIGEITLFNMELSFPLIQSESLDL